MFSTPSALYEKSKSLGSGGSMVARLKLKEIDGVLFCVTFFSAWINQNWNGNEKVESFFNLKQGIALRVSRKELRGFEESAKAVSDGTTVLKKVQKEHENPFGIGLVVLI